MKISFSSTIPKSKRHRSNPQFIEFKTKDGLTLPGLLCESERAKAVAIYLHGNGSSSVFYDFNTGKQKFFASALDRRGISILFFNNRGAHIIKKLKIKRRGKLIRKSYGMTFEKIKECILDIDGAISLLQKRGYKKFYLMGESTGANKICVYNFYKKKGNRISKYVLLCGGDDTGIYYHMLGKSRFWKLLKTAKRKIKAKRGEEIIKEMLPNDFFSYTAFFDIANPDGDYNTFPFYEVLRKIKLSKKPLFRHFKSIKKSSLVIYGDKDEYAWGNVPKVVDILKNHQPEFDYRIIKGADHGFKGHEATLARVVAKWI